MRETTNRNVIETFADTVTDTDTVIETVTDTSNTTNAFAQSNLQPQPKLTAEIKIEGTTFEVNGFFKTSGKTITEKLFGLMSKELDNQVVFCYNGGIPQEIRL